MVRDIYPLLVKNLQLLAPADVFRGQVTPLTSENNISIDRIFWGFPKLSGQISQIQIFLGIYALSGNFPFYWYYFLHYLLYYLGMLSFHSLNACPFLITQGRLVPTMTLYISHCINLTQEKQFFFFLSRSSWALLFFQHCKQNYPNNHIQYFPMTRYLLLNHYMFLLSM